MYSSFHTSRYNQNDSDSSLDPLDPELHADDFEERQGHSYMSASFSSSVTSSTSGSFRNKRKEYGHALADASSDLSSSSSSVRRVEDRRASTELIDRYAYATSSSRDLASKSLSGKSSKSCASNSTTIRRIMTTKPRFKRTMVLVFGNICLIFAIASMSAVSPNGLIHAIGSLISTVRRMSLYHTHRALCSTDEMALVSNSFRRALITVTGIFIGYTQSGQDDPDIVMLLNCDTYWLPYIPVPNHLQVVCPERKESPCPKGSYVKSDCSCTTADEDPCSACPEGTRCQKGMVNLPLMCIDCTCSFCNAEQEPCCSFDGETNKCSSNTSDGIRNECTLESGYFAPFHGTGGICENIEITYTHPPSGCSCVPSATEPCTYNPNDRSIDDQCFVCDARDLSHAVPGGPNKCDDCRDCLEQCHPCVGEASSFEDMRACLTSKEMNSRSDCRESCAISCVRK